MECSHSLLLFLPPFFLLLLSPYTCGYPSYPGISNRNFSDCFPAPYTCGTLTFEVGYPFLIYDRPNYCGYPGFYLSCINTATAPRISINNKWYEVQKIDYDNNLLTVLDTDFAVVGEMCPKTFSNTTIDDSLFAYSDSVRNLTLYFNCTSPVGGQDLYRCFVDVSGHHSLYRLNYWSFTDVLGLECGLTVLVPLDKAAETQLVRDRNLTAALQ